MRFVILLILISIYLPYNALAEHIDLPLDSEGWTVFTPSDDSRIMYVSAEGNDGTGQVYDDNDSEVADPFNPVGINAYLTYSAAESQVRDGYPDWVLIRRGDTFVENTLGDPDKGGRSTAEPQLVASYGSIGNPPLFKTGSSRGINIGDNYFALSGITFYAHTRDPDGVDYVDSAGTSGFQRMALSENHNGFLIEGCVFKFYTNNVFQSDNGYRITDTMIRRTLVLDNYKAVTEHAQGMFGTGNDNITLEENIFIHNGWYHDSTGTIGVADLYQHNTYFAEVRTALFKNNMFIQGSSMGNKWTANNGANSSSEITVTGNLYLDNEIGVGIGGNQNDVGYRFKNIEVSDNVFMHGGLSNPTNRGLGWNISTNDWDIGSIHDNYIVHQTAEYVNNAYGIMLYAAGMRNVNIYNNITYNIFNGYSFYPLSDNGIVYSNIGVYGNIFQSTISDPLGIMRLRFDGTGMFTFADNIYYSNNPDPENFVWDDTNITFATWKTTTGDNSVFSQHTFPDPTRDIDTYQASIGETATIDAFIENVRAMDRYNWDTRYDTDTVNTWIKRGFKELHTGQTQAGTGAFTTGTGSLTTQ